MITVKADFITMKADFLFAQPERQSDGIEAYIIAMKADFLFVQPDRQSDGIEMLYAENWQPLSARGREYFEGSARAVFGNGARTSVLQFLSHRLLQGLP